MSSVGVNLMNQCRKIICVGRNYAAHAKELGNAVPTKPVLFLKPPSSLVSSPSPILVPADCADLHHEIELGVVIGTGGTAISVDEAPRHVAGYVLALDMTARAIQEADKKQGLPWLYAKGQDGFCPISSFHSVSSLGPSFNPEDSEVWCTVDGQPRQRGRGRDMIFPVFYLISYVSHFFTLQPGDLILTGTPEGVGPVKPGQVVKGGITGFPQFDIEFRAEKRKVTAPPPPVRHQQHSKL